MICIYRVVIVPSSATMTRVVAWHPGAAPLDLPPPTTPLREPLQDYLRPRRRFSQQEESHQHALRIGGHAQGRRRRLSHQEEQQYVRDLAYPRLNLQKEQPFSRSREAYLRPCEQEEDDLQFSRSRESYLRAPPSDDQYFVRDSLLRSSHQEQQHFSRSRDTHLRASHHAPRRSRSALALRPPPELHARDFRETLGPCGGLGRERGSGGREGGGELSVGEALSGPQVPFRFCPALAAVHIPRASLRVPRKQRYVVQSGSSSVARSSLLRHSFVS